MSSIVFGSFEAREVLLRDCLRRAGRDPARELPTEAPGLQRPEFYVAASWDNCDGSFEVEEEDEDAFEE